MKFIFATDKRFLDGLRVTIVSLLETAGSLNPFSFEILHSSLTPHDIESILRLCERHSFGRSKVNFINIDSHDFSGVRTIRGSKMTYARMLIPELFPDQAEVIYCDCDILFLKGIDEIIQCPNDGKLLAAAGDMTVQIVANDCPWEDVSEDMRQLPHFNCGLIKLNLDLWRKVELGSRAIEISRNEPEKCRYWDQSVLNYLCLGRVGFFAQANNYQMRGNSAMPEDPKINIHYVGARKPWMVYSRMKSYQLWRKYYRDGVSQVPFYALRPSFWFVSIVVFFGSVTGVRSTIHRLRSKILGW